MQPNAWAVVPLLIGHMVGVQTNTSGLSSNFDMQGPSHFSEIKRFARATAMAPTITTVVAFGTQPRGLTSEPHHTWRLFCYWAPCAQDQPVAQAYLIALGRSREGGEACLERKKGASTNDFE